MRDSQTVVIRHNVFGSATIAGVAYRANATKPAAIRVSDSGKSSRTDLRNIKIMNNVLTGERMVGCELPDGVVYCANNR